MSKTVICHEKGEGTGRLEHEGTAEHEHQFLPEFSTDFAVLPVGVYYHGSLILVIYPEERSYHDG